MKKILILAFLIYGCGPVETKVHPVPGQEQEKAKREELQAAEANLKAQKEQLEAQTKELSIRSEKSKFVFDEKEKTCKNAEGLKGYNTSPETLGPCSLISDIFQFNRIQTLTKDANSKIDMRGTVIFSIAIPKNSLIKNVDFRNSTWVNTNLSQVKFENSILTGSRYYDTPTAFFLSGTVVDAKNSNLTEP